MLVSGSVYHLPAVGNWDDRIHNLNSKIVMWAMKKKPSLFRVKKGDEILPGYVGIVKKPF